MSIAGLQLGAPGVYPAPRPRESSFNPVRLDVAGFVGVALRGPVNEPVQVNSWNDYLRRFGGYLAPQGLRGPDRLLPYAVKAFFDLGGVRAYVVRVAPAYDGPGTDPGQTEATASFRLGALDVIAADEGTWANRLRLRLEFEVEARFEATISLPDEVPLPPGATVLPGSLLRVHRVGLPAEGVFVWALEDAVRVDDRGRSRRVAVLEQPFEPATESAEVAVVTGAVVAVEADPEAPRSERLGGLGLHPAHPRFIGVALRESQLVAPAGPVTAPLLPADPLLAPVEAETVREGADRWQLVDGRSFFDDEPAGSDPLDEQPHRGVDALGRVAEVSMLCAPDLTWRWQGTGIDLDEPLPSPRTGRFGPCRVDARTVSYSVEAPDAHLSGRDDLDEILARQERLVEVAELRRRFVALLDVPRDIPTGGIARWRSRFDSSYAAAYYPWLGVPRVRGPGLVESPPTGFAAGVIAGRERRLGLPWGPANELAVGAVTMAETVSDALHDRLHPLGVNVFRAERDGFRLTAARTLSSDPQYRQLSVRRLMTMLALTLERQSQWIVFEPNTPALRNQLSNSLIMLLRGLRRQGTFAGATEAESFFVRCDDELNPAAMQASGQLVAMVGVAPAEPLEYLVLRITQDAEGQVQVVNQSE